jgi:hypothetical protein
VLVRPLSRGYVEGGGVMSEPIGVRTVDSRLFLLPSRLWRRLQALAVPYLKRLVAGFPPRRPGFSSVQVLWDLWWTKWHWGRFFFPSTSISPANHHSTKFPILIITRGKFNRRIGGRRAEWTQMDSTPPPPLFKLKRKRL